MRRSMNVRISMLAVIAGLVWAIELTWAQEQDRPSAGVAVGISGVNPHSDTVFSEPSLAKVFVTRRDKAPGGGMTIRQAAEAVRDAKGDEARAAAEKTLAELLNKSFDEDMARRESELTKIEERLGKLRDLQVRRSAKKQEIIELQTKVALNEAEGLGFYDGQDQGRLGFKVFDGAAKGFDDAARAFTVPDDMAPPATMPAK